MPLKWLKSSGTYSALQTASSAPISPYYHQDDEKEGKNSITVSFICKICSLAFAFLFKFLITKHQKLSGNGSRLYYIIIMRHVVAPARYSKFLTLMRSTTTLLYVSLYYFSLHYFSLHYIVRAFL